MNIILTPFTGREADGNFVKSIKHHTKAELLLFKTRIGVIMTSSSGL